MIRSRGLLAIVLAVALAASAGAGCGGDAEETGGPVPEAAAAPPLPEPRETNFVVVMTDDQDIASLERMPKARKHLAAAGVEFETSFATSPECCPSRASLLTGRYAHNHGVLANDPPDGGFGAFEDEATIATRLERAGYRTGHFGKYLNGYGWSALGHDPDYVPPGWDEWWTFTEHTEFRMYGYEVNHNGRRRSYGDRERDYQTDVLSRRANRFVARSARDGKPFFALVSTLAPHAEGVLKDNPEAKRNPRPAPRHLGSFEELELPRTEAFNEADAADKPSYVADRRRLRRKEVKGLERLHRSRAESLLAVDELIEDLVRTLKREGALEDTVVILASDNGFMLGEHRLIGKKRLYEESVRVPLLVRGPGFPRGEVREQLVGNIDLAPTIFELAGVRPLRRMDGISLVELAGDPEAAAERALVLEMVTPDGFAAVRTPGFVFAEHEDGAAELYALDEDPLQLTNVAEDPGYRDVRDDLARRLAKLRSCRKAACTE